MICQNKLENYYKYFGTINGAYGDLCRSLLPYSRSNKNNYTASFTDNSFDSLRSGEGLYTISVIEPVAISTGLRLASFEEIPFL